jgi:hypothetical protein
LQLRANFLQLEHVDYPKHRAASTPSKDGHLINHRCRIVTVRFSFLLACKRSRFNRQVIPHGPGHGPDHRTGAVSLFSSAALVVGMEMHADPHAGDQAGLRNAMSAGSADAQRHVLAIMELRTRRLRLQTPRQVGAN